MRRILLIAAAAALLLPAGARAAVTIGPLDTTDYPTLRVSAVTSESAATAPTLRENGHKVEDLVAQSLGARRAMAIAIDRSRSMSGPALADAIAAAKVFLRTKNQDDEVALFSFSSRADQLTGFSSDPRDVAAALGGLRADTESGTALYDTVVDAADALARDELPGRVLILVTDGHNASSSGTLDSAIAAARDVGVDVYPIGISSGSQFSPAALQRLAAATGGAYSAASPSSALVRVSHDLVRRLARTWELTYKTTVPPGERVRLALTQPGAGAAQRTFVIPRDAGRPPRESIFSKFFFHSGLGNVIAALVIGLFVLVAVMHLLGARNIRRVQRRLEPHVPSADAARAEQKEHRRRFAVLGGLFSATDHAFGRFSAWRGLRTALERADSPLRPAEFFYIMVGAGAITGLVLLMFGLPGFIALLGFLVGSVVPYAILARKGNQRQKAFDDQLPDLLMTMGASLRAGHTFRQSMQACVKEAKEPASKEFRHVLLETGLGRSMDEALMDAARRLGSRNFDYVISVVSIQNEVGGSLANLFDMVSDAVRQRQQFSKKVRALTSMGRTSAYVLCGLPFFLLVLLSIINYQYMKPIFTTSTGKVLLVIALIGMAIGGVVLRKIVSFRMS
jgi:tight adherence protein B